ncbi:cytochrome P450 [Quadrisphaera sp. DSM 44207]|uniref:cytochrome P450 family protein n=1 Tax=Quadrisphaera sp. DSM 44207 TaxID=1881057 RepID=UPI0008875AD2|nr:cytochrome P450 [Quadrisphaera sp. DSM 44207]SDQ39703.1 Cytochrome P450 [Quadrisphaera sp. DSM 44207]
MTNTSEDVRGTQPEHAASSSGEGGEEVSGIDAGELFTPAFTADPYPTWARVRESTPVCPVRSPRFDSFFITRYDDAKAALSDARLSKDLYGPRQDYLKFFGPNSALLNQNMLNSDPPEHTRLRRLVTQAFTPRRVEALRPKVERVVDDLIDAFAPTGRAELMEDFAFPLPVTVISDLLGVPEQDRTHFFEVTHIIRSRGGAGRGTEEDRLAVQNAQQQLADYLSDLIARKREQPQDDLLTALIAARDEQARLSERELVSTAFLLLFAGHQTTSDFLGNAVVALLTNPEQLALLKASPQLLPAAVEELLRFDGSVPIASPRIATEDVEYGGVHIPAGSIVTVAINAANHDPAHAQDPDVLRLDREDTSHIAFGHGIHFCLGISLARMEIQVALAGLLRRLPDLALAVPAEQVRRLPGASPFRGLLELPLRFTPVPVGAAASA